MATRVPDYKFVEKRGRKSMYPWDEWMTGETWCLVRGVDFFVIPDSMKNLIYVIAKSRGLKATVVVEGSSIYFKATPVESHSRSRQTGVTLDGNGNTIRRT